MLEIKFDDASRKKVFHDYLRGVNPAYISLAEYYATEANRQAREYVSKCGEISDEELAEELRTAWCNYYDAEEIWIVLAHTARELLAFSQKAETVPAIDWKARAEKAEARLEKFRTFGEHVLRGESGWRHPANAIGYALAEAGFAVQPEIHEQPLRVVDA